MLLHIPQVLTPPQLSYFQQQLQAAEWVDGKITAGHQSGQVKRNLQLPELPNLERCDYRNLPRINKPFLSNLGTSASPFDSITLNLTTFAYDLP